MAVIYYVVEDCLGMRSFQVISREILLKCEKVCLRVELSSGKDSYKHGTIWG